MTTIVKATLTLPTVEKAYELVEAAERQVRTVRTFQTAIKATATGHMAKAVAQAIRQAALRETSKEAAAATYARAKDLQAHAGCLLGSANKLRAELEKPEREERAGPSGKGGRPRKGHTVRGLSRAQRERQRERSPLAGIDQKVWDAYHAACKKLRHTPTGREDNLLAQSPPEQQRAIVAKMAAGEARSVKDAKKLLKREEQDAIPDDLPKSADRYELHACDLLDAPIKPGSIDVIITDPPYPEEFLPVYERLSRLAARALKPGGSCIVMVGQSFLPEVLARLGKHLEYQWTLAYLTPGAQSAPSLKQRHINSFWKPLLWFVNGKYKGAHVGDVIKSDVNDNDKRFHDWGQSESGMRRIVEAFSKPGDRVLDPFCGGGTTGVVAVQLNRFFVGVDNNEKQIRITSDRLLRISAKDAT